MDSSPHRLVLLFGDDQVWINVTSSIIISDVITGLDLFDLVFALRVFDVIDIVFTESCHCFDLGELSNEISSSSRESRYIGSRFLGIGSWPVGPPSGRPNIQHGRIYRTRSQPHMWASCGRSESLSHSPRSFGSFSVLPISGVLFLQRNTRTKTRAAKCSGMYAGCRIKAGYRIRLVPGI